MGKWRQILAAGVVGGVSTALTLAFVGMALRGYPGLCNTAEAESGAACLREWVTPIIGLLAAVAGAVTVYALFRQIELGRDATFAAVRAASAAERTFDLSVATTQRQLRAYVGIDSCRISNVTLDGRYEIEILVKNSGLTPAYKVRGRSFSDFGRDFHSTKLMRRSQDVASIATLNAGATITQPVFGVPLSSGLLADIYSGEIVIAVGGTLVYTDVFGKTRRTIWRRFLYPPHLKDGAARMMISSRQNVSN